MADESFREIQLSGKQLIALFMAAAVVLIATFLSGVLVGRGVRSQQEAVTSASAEQAGDAADPTASKPAPPPEQPARQEPPPAPPPQAEEAPAPAARGGTPSGPVAAPAAAPPLTGAGYFLKVVAYRQKAQADKLAAGLSAKGHAAYVAPVTGSKGTALYSVRVGPFATRKEAEAAKQRLEQEDYKPSIAR